MNLGSVKVVVLPLLLIIVDIQSQCFTDSSADRKTAAFRAIGKPVIAVHDILINSLFCSVRKGDIHYHSDWLTSFKLFSKCVAYVNHSGFTPVILNSSDDSIFLSSDNSPIAMFCVCPT